MIRISNEVQTGIAGEYLVCADLTMKGFVAYPTMQGLPYDVLLDTGGRMLKVQVKTTATHKTIPQRKKDSQAYIFQIKRAGKNGDLRYTEREIDVFAVVALDTMQVGYLLNKDMPTTINIRVDAFRGSYYDEKGIQDFEKVKELNKTIKNQREVSRITGISESAVSRYLQPNYKPFITQAKYMSDFVRDRDWFLNIP